MLPYKLSVFQLAIVALSQNSLVQIALENQEKKEVNQSRQRRASESDTMPERAEKMPRPAPAKNVDIIKMLSKAQDEYDKVKTDPSLCSVLWGSRGWRVYYR